MADSNLFPFRILIEPYGVYVMTERAFTERPPRNASRDRWQQVNAGSAAQAMGMGWQIRNAGGAEKAAL